jgi:cell division protease FtsH
MVCEYGMSDELGPLTFGKKEEQIFLGREISQHRDYSEYTAQKIDAEVRGIVNNAYEDTCKLINDHIDIVHNMANALLEKETLTNKDLDEIISAGKGEQAEDKGSDKQVSGD